MNSVVFALLLKPFIMLAFMVVCVIPPLYAFHRWFPEGRVKRFLLTSWRV